MRQASLWTQLALLSSTVHAFYPYTPKWLKALEEKDGSVSKKTDVKQRSDQFNAPSSDRIVREAARLARKYDRRRPATSAQLLRRDNDFSILEAADTNEERAAPIDQDGTDYSYFVSVQLGSKKKELLMLIDTGAGSSWVMGSDCSSEACDLHDSFGSGDSDTLKISDQDFSLNYGTGKVEGTLATDTISVAGMSLQYQFGIASETSDDFASFAFDGILGLAMNEGASENFLDILDEAEGIDANVFSVALSRAADGVNTGEIKFGGINKSKYQGDISYTPLASDNGDWAIQLDDTAYDGKKSGAGGITAYIDTGTTFIFGPEDVVKAFHSVIPGAKSSDGMSYTVPCDSNKSLTFTFGGSDFTVSPKDWISPESSSGSCTSNIYGQEVVKGSWLLGASFIKNVYAVFDKDQSRIGFAQQGEGAPESSTSKTTVASSTKISSSPSTTSTTSTTLSETTTTEAAESTETTETTESSESSDSAESTSSSEEEATTTTFAATTMRTTMPSLGLSGQESVSSTGTGTADADASEATNDDDESGSSKHNHSTIAVLLSLASLFALLA